MTPAPDTTSARVQLFSAQFDALTMEETLARIEQLIAERRTTQHVVINVAKLVMMERDALLRQIVNACGLINADGQGIVWGARLLGLRVPERVAGIDLFQRLVERAAVKGWRLYFLGARPAIVQETVRRFQTRYPTLQVAGFRDGYYARDEEDQVVAAIRRARADLLFVAMSSPQKEVFLNRYAAVMDVPFLMGVGGSFDVIAGHVQRAPLWMQQAGLEWFHRLLSEPRRMGKRYVVTNAMFLGMLLSALWRTRAMQEEPSHAR